MRRSRRGQIVIPAMMVFPTLFLFVYLIYETSKLSREKIRHQFAIDAAAFVEMTNYSDFLNRTAYVNGAFPMRIFEEGYWDFNPDCEGKTSYCPPKKEDVASYATILFNNGAFPHVGGTYDNGHSPEKNIDGGSWKIEYGGAGAQKNESPPEMGALPPATGDNAKQWELFTLKNANDYWHPYDLATEIYKLYVQIYTLLGSVEDAQFKVLQRLTTQGTPHSFLQKSYWLNTGDPVGDAAQLARSFDRGLGGSNAFQQSIKAYCLQKLDYWGNKHNPAGGIQPYVPQLTTPDVDLSADSEICNSDIGNTPGLFQIMWMNPRMITRLKDINNDGYHGLPLSMNWSIPANNYWNVDFPTLMAQKFPSGDLHTTISLQGDPTNSPAVWPDPTPKFQVRQYP